VAFSLSFDHIPFSTSTTTSLLHPPPPMPPKPKTTSKATSKPKMTPEDHDVKMTDWARRLWDALSNEGKYNEGHENFFNEFKKLRDEGRAMNLTTWMMTLIDHVAPIYDHVASKGYNSCIHYNPLREAATNFSQGKPVVDWKGPPDPISRSPTPILQPSSPHPQSPPPVQSRKKTHSAISDQSEHDESEKESPNLPDGDPVKPKLTLPSTDGMERCLIKCSKCATRKHGCHVNPKTTKAAAAACFECNHWRLKCSLAPTRTKKGEDEEEGPLKEQVPKEQVPKRRYYRKPNQVPPGQSGQFTGAPVLTFSDNH
jgi:hypothetical protein